MIHFNNVVSNPRYYLEEPNRLNVGFQGNGAKLLGLEGDFNEAAYLRLFNGLNPHDGDKLTQRLKADRKGATDITFNMPKTASIVAEVGNDTRMVDMHYRAVKEAMAEVERQARLYVRKDTGEKHPKGWRYPERYSGNLVWVPFGHGGNRENEPHTHVHCVVFNVAYDRDETAWKAVDLGHVDRPGIQKAYHDNLIKGFRQLGYKVREEGIAFEIVGVPAEIKAKFSRRNAEIQELQEQYDKKRTGGKMSGDERAKLGLYTRAAKVLMDFEERKKQWVESLTERQYGIIRKLVHRAKQAVMDRWNGGPSRQHGMGREQGAEHDHERV